MDTADNTIDTSSPTLTPPAQAYQKNLEPGAQVAPPTVQPSTPQSSATSATGAEQSGPSLLVQKWRAKYGNQYDDMDDDTLQRKIMARYPGDYDDLAGAHSQQEMDLQNRIHATTQHIAGLRKAQMDTAPAESDLVDAQKLLGQLQGVDTDTPGWTSKLRIGTPTPGTTGGLETTGQQAAGVTKETGTSLVDTAKSLLHGARLAFDPTLMYSTYRDAVASGMSHDDAVATAETKKQDQETKLQNLKGTIDDYLKHPDRESGVLLANTLVSAVPMAGDAGAFLTDAGETAEELAANTRISNVGAETTHAFNPKTGEIEPKQPSLIQRVLKGEQVAQPALKNAIGKAVDPTLPTQPYRSLSPAQAQMVSDNFTLGKVPLVHGNETIMDLHIDGLKDLEQAAYEAQDNAAGFDVKELKKSLANDQFKLKQLGNTDADLTQKGNLIESINDAQSRIADAEAKMKDANVDPNLADTLHKRRMAANSIKKALIQNVSADGQTVNTTGLSNSMKKLRFTEYGDRLEQFLGSADKADQFMADIDQASKLGVKAKALQAYAKVLGKIAIPLVPTAIGAAGLYEALKPSQ